MTRYDFVGYILVPAVVTVEAENEEEGRDKIEDKKWDWIEPDLAAWSELKLDPVPPTIVDDDLVPPIS